MNNFLQTYDQIDGVCAINDSMAEGAAVAAEAAGAPGRHVHLG